MKYFIAMNNCSSRKIFDQQRVEANELQYPTLVAFYKDHAGQLLAGLPTNLSVGVGYATLANYDSAKASFPLGGNGLATKVELPSPIGIGSTGGSFCGSQFRGTLKSRGVLPSSYILDTGHALTITEVPMKLADASALIEKMGPNRGIMFAAQLTVPKDASPKTVEHCLGTSDYKAICGKLPASLDRVDAIKRGWKSTMFAAPVPDQLMGAVYPK